VVALRSLLGPDPAAPVLTRCDRLLAARVTYGTVTMSIGRCGARA